MIWPFNRKPELSPDCYLRWLRAEKPDLLQFLRLSELEQEGLATIGDLWRAELVEQALGADLGAREAAEDDPADVEASLAQQLAAKVAGRILARGRPGAGDRPPVSFSGYGERQEVLRRQRQEAKDRAGTQLFGRPPDAPSGEGAATA